MGLNFMPIWGNLKRDLEKVWVYILNQIWFTLNHIPHISIIWKLPMVGKYPAFVNSMVKIVKPQKGILACFLVNWVKLVPWNIREFVIFCSLTSTAFPWYSSLQPCSICSWERLEEKFHKHFYNGTSELKLSNLISVKQERDESVLDFIKWFRDVKNDVLNS